MACRSRSVPHVFLRLPPEIFLDFRQAASPDPRLDAFRAQKKDCKFVLAVLLSESKGITRATNARVRIAQNDPLVHAVSPEDSGVTV